VRKKSKWTAKASRDRCWADVGQQHPRNQEPIVTSSLGKITPPHDHSCLEILGSRHTLAGSFPRFPCCAVTQPAAMRYTLKITCRNPQSCVEAKDPGIMSSLCVYHPLPSLSCAGVDIGSDARPATSRHLHRIWRSAKERLESTRRVEVWAWAKDAVIRCILLSRPPNNPMGSCPIEAFPTLPSSRFSVRTGRWAIRNHKS